VNPPAPLLRDYIETWLRDEGHKTKMALADDGNDALFSFRSRGLEYLVNTDEEHPDFLHLRLIMVLDADVSLATLADAAQGVQSAKPIVKIRYTSDEVEFHVEQFLAPGQLDTIFWRCVQILRDSNDAFFAELRAAAPASAARAFISEVTRELHLS
jgi:hypothetical protein